MWNWHSLATTVTVNNGSPFASELGIFYLLDPGESNKLIYQRSDKENSQSSQSSPWSSLASQRPGRALGTSKSGRSTPSHLWAKLVLSGSGPLFAEGAQKRHSILYRQTLGLVPSLPCWHYLWGSATHKLTVREQSVGTDCPEIVLGPLDLFSPLSLGVFLSF